MAKQKANGEAVKEDQPEGKAAEKAVKQSSSKPAEQIFSPENLDMIHDVMLDITVEIGNTKIKLSELLNLKKGSVIELNQAAEEPLTIYANDKPIAKGLVMEANGKYCVQVI